MVRHATDASLALKVANAMEEARANVFSITPYGTGGGFAIWAKIPNAVHIPFIDKAIAAALDKPPL